MTETASPRAGPKRQFRWLTALFLLPLLAGGLAAQEGEPPSMDGYVQLYLQVAKGEDPFIIAISALNTPTWHFEARYNNEDSETTSLWVGRNFATGSTVQLEITPLAGLMLGQVDGMGPGVEATVMWKALTFYDEATLVIPFEPEPSYFITWSTLTWRFGDVLQPGVTAQRFRVYSGEREVDWGLALNSEFGRISTGIYAYAPFGSSPFWQLSGAWSF